MDSRWEQIPMWKLPSSSTHEVLQIDQGIPQSHKQPLLHRTVNSRDVSTQPYGDAVNAWVPSMLRRGVLISFAITFLLLVTALEIVLRLSDERRGFGPTDSNLHYIWTYGPTAGECCGDFGDTEHFGHHGLQESFRWVASTLRALLDVLVCYESYCHESAKYSIAESHYITSTTAERHTVLTLIAALWTQVDYRSRQIQPWQELASKPQPAENNLLLDYISPNPIISFYKSARHHHWPVTVALIGSFLLKALIVISTTLFSLQMLAVPIPQSLTMTEQLQFDRFNSATVDDLAASIYAGVAFKNLSYPPGTNSRSAVEMFNTSTRSPANSYSLTADVRTTVGDLICGPATLSDLRVYCPADSGCTTVQATLAAENDDCRIPSFPKDNTSFYVEGIGYGGWYGDVLPGLCQEDNGTFVRERLVVFSMTLHGSITGNGSEGLHIQNTTALICESSLTVEQSTVTVDESGFVQMIRKNSEDPTQPQITPVDLSDAIRNTIDQLEYHTTIPVNSSVNVGYSTVYFQDFFAMILASQDSDTIDGAMDSQLLSRGAQHVFQGVAAQISKRYLMLASSMNPVTEFEGTIEYSQQRLFVRALSMRSMEGILSVLALASIYLALNSSSRSTPQDPASIARLASMISHSGKLTTALSLTGSWPSISLEELLKGTYVSKFTSSAYGATSRGSTTSKFTIEHDGPLGTRAIHVREQYWRPFTTSWYFKTALILIPLCFIIPLEVLLTQSQQKNGFLGVRQNKQTQYASTLVPAAIMALTKLLFSAFDFNLHILDPYVQLKKGFAKAGPSLLNKSIYTWKTQAFWRSFTSGRTSVGASTLAVVFASFLTIAASGLYSVEQVGFQRDTNLTRLDTFFNPVAYIAKPGYANTNGVDYGSALAARLVVSELMNYPPWTFEQYVSPTLASPLDGLGYSNSTLLVGIQAPVRRGYLNCSLVPAEQVTLNYSAWDHGSVSNNGIDITWSFPDAVNCTNLIWNYRGETNLFQLSDGPIAKWQSYQFLDTDAACPSSWAVFGNWSGRRATEINIMMCWSSIQEIQASVEFEYPSWKIRSLIVDENTNKTISSTQDTQLDLAGWIFAGAKGPENMDGTFAAFLRNDSTKIGDLDTTLLERSNFDKLYARIQDVYGMAFAQVLNGQGRNPNITEKPIIAATITTPSFRLQQSPISTRILQGLLLAMMLCAILSLSTSNLSQILPKNPCSIAAQASLVVDSEMMAKFTRESQWMNDQEFETLLAGSRYSMGWTGTGEESSQRFGIDVAEAVWQGERNQRISRFSGLRRRSKRTDILISDNLEPEQ